MQSISASRADDIEATLNSYGDMLYRICLIMLGSPSDAEDVIQETLIKYMQKSPEFSGEEHKKAWLITVATNKCRDMLRFKARHPQVDIEEFYQPTSVPDTSGIIDALMELPERFRTVLTLYYVEEYSTRDIAKIIGRSQSAVKMRLQKGRKLLESSYRREYLENGT